MQPVVSLNGSLIRLRESRPPPTSLPPGNDVNAYSEFHTRAPSHFIDNYKAFNFNVQDLLDSKVISFAPTGPNVNNNPMPPHVGHSVNMIEESIKHNLISNVDMMKTHLLVLKEQLLLKNVFPGCTSDYAHCLNNPQGCGEVKKGIQLLIDQGTFLVEQIPIADDVSTLEIPYYPVQIPVANAPMTPLVITVPTPFPYKSTKVVPWNYSSTTWRKSLLKFKSLL